MSTSKIQESAISNYNDFDFCDHTRGIDNLLDRYRQDRNRVVFLAQTEPTTLIKTIWNRDSPLSIDNDCKCNLINPRTTFACSQCKNLKKILDLRSGGIKKTFTIECGESAGKVVKITSYPINNPHLSRDLAAVDRARFYKKQYSKLTSCGTPDVTDCISGDSFTIQTLITWMTNKLFEERGLNHCLTLHTAFICGGVGYCLQEAPNVSDLKRIDSNTVKSIMFQLIIILKELSSVSFSHGNPTIDGLIFSKDPVSYEYDGIRVVGPITLQITNMSNSSATFNGVHFFPESIKTSMCIEANMFVPEIYNKSITMAYCSSNASSDDVTTKACKSKNSTLYKLSSNTIELYNSIRHIGFPLYAGSFDFYCFMVSLMLQPNIFEIVRSDENLYRFWAMMWTEEDLIEVEKQLTEKETAINIIKNKQLRCDILDHMWSLVKLGW